MSRSFKRTPITKGCRIEKYAKRNADKNVRKENNLLRCKSNKYRRVYESWNIFDYKFYSNKLEAFLKDELESWKRIIRK